MGLKSDFLTRLVLAFMPAKVPTKRTKPMFYTQAERDRYNLHIEVEDFAYQMRRFKRTGFATAEEEEAYYDELAKKNGH